MILDSYINPTILEWGVNVLAYVNPSGISGPFYLDAAQTHAPGAIAGGVFRAGDTVGGVFQAGSTAAEINQ